MKEKDHENLIDSLQDEINKIYPELKAGFKSGFSIDGEIQNARFEYTHNQKIFKGTIYDPVVTNTFIHYTSLDSLFGIINSQTLRMYNLNKMNDPREFDYLLHEKGLRLDKESIDIFKRSLFLSSFCEFKNNEDEDFNLWRLYGNHGNGVAVVFEIKNKQPEWYNILIGKVNYEKDSEDAQKLITIIEIFNRYMKQGLKILKFPELIGILLLLNKNKIWSIEKEYRIMTFLEYDKYHYKTELFKNPLVDDTLNISLDFSGNEIAFIEMPIHKKLEGVISKITGEEQKTKALQSFPNIEIKEIKVGYNVRENLFNEIKRFVTLFSSNKKGKYIPVTKSIFTDSFN